MKRGKKILAFLLIITMLLPFVMISKNAPSICNEYSGRSGRKKQTVRCIVYA